MTHGKRLWVAAAIIVAILLISFIASVPHAREVALKTLTHTEATTTPVVAIKDTFRNGTHTITGSIEAPTACTTVTADTTPIQDANASTTQSILVALSMPADAGVCLQVATIVPFSVTIDAPAALPISVTVNGEEASTTSL